MLQQQQQRHAAAASGRRLQQHGRFASVAPAARTPRALASVQQQQTSTSLADLIAWAKSKGTSVDKVATAPNLQLEGAAVLVAAKDLGAGEAVLSVSDSLWLGAGAVRKSAIGGAVQQLEPWVQIALLLVAGPRQAGAEWAPYFSTLPQHPDTPLFWNLEQLALLQGSQCAANAGGYRAFFEAKYNELLGPQGLLPASQFPRDVYTFERFVAAVATVRSRTHAPLEGDALSLVPLADAVAHSGQGNTAWRVKQAGALLPFGKAGQALVLEATRPIRKGEQLTMDYAPGKLDNTLLLDYGVLDALSPRPGYTLSLALDPSDRLVDDKLDVVENNQAAVAAGAAASMQFPVAPAGQPPETMMALLRLTTLKGADAFLLEPVFSADVWSHMCEPISEANEKDVCDKMIQGAQAVLDQYPGSIGEDLALLRSGTLKKGSREEAAVKVRLGEREALDSMMQWFETRKGTLKRLAYYQERRLRRLGLIDDEGRTTYDSFFEKGIA